VDGLGGLFLPKASAGRGDKVLSSPELVAVSREIQRNVQSLMDAEGGSKVILVIDQLDLLLAAGGDQIHTVDVGDMLMGLREVRGF